MIERRTMRNHRTSEERRRHVQRERLSMTLAVILALAGSGMYYSLKNHVLPQLDSLFIGEAVAEPSLYTPRGPNAHRLAESMNYDRALMECEAVPLSAVLVSARPTVHRDCSRVLSG